MSSMIPNLLVTDDDRAFRQVICEGLSRRGFRTTEACDGQEALEVIRGHEVHLVIVDVHMPRLSGLDVMRKLSEMGNRPPCVLMSARLDDKIQEEAQRMKAYQVLSKPVRLAQLSELVCGALADVYGWHPSEQ